MKTEYPDFEKMVYPTIFFLSSCGGFAKKDFVGQMLQEMFGIEDIDADNSWKQHLDDFCSEMIKQDLLLEPQQNDIWELSLMGRMEFVKQMMFYKIYQDEMIKNLGEE